MIEQLVEWLRVTANISNNLPIISCQLSYNITFSNGTYPNGTVVQMREHNGLWYATIDNLQGVATVDIRVIVDDNAYTIESSGTTVQVQK